MTLGEKIKLLMEYKGLNRKGFAQICGVSADTVGEWSNDKSKPNKVALQRIVDTFEIDIDKFLDDNYPLVQEANKTELQYINVGDYNLDALLVELKEFILNDYNLKLNDQLVDKQIRKTIADSIDIGIALAKQQIENV
jgi:transcriptional regulator with XRE-family HTH domain